LTFSSTLPGDVGLHSLTIEGYYSSYVDAVAPTVTHEQTIQVTLEPSCSFSPITQATPLTDMSANLFESATQALPLYSHQYKSAWDASGVP